MSGLTVIAAGSDSLSEGKIFLMLSTTWMTFAPGWRWMLTISAGVVFIHACRRLFSGRDLDPRDVGEPDRRAIAVGDDRLRIILRVADLIVGVDRRGLRRPVEISLGRVDVEVGDRRAQIVEVDAHAGQRERIDVDADGRPLPAGDRNQADAGELRQFRHEPGFDDVLDLGQLHRVRSDAQRQDRRVGRIDLGVDRRRRQVGGQKIAGGVDRRLHLLLGNVEADVEAELQSDDRGAGGALPTSSGSGSASGRIAARAAPSPTRSSPPGSRRDRRSGPGSSDSRPRAGPRAAGSGRP